MRKAFYIDLYNLYGLKIIRFATTPEFYSQPQECSRYFQYYQVLKLLP